MRSFLRGLLYPDRFLFWRKSAARHAAEVARREEIDLILVSFPPASAVSLALDVHRKTGIPLALDYRDRWFGYIY